MPQSYQTWIKTHKTHCFFYISKTINLSVFSLPDQARLLSISVCCRGSSSQATMRVWTAFIQTCWRCSSALRSVSQRVHGLTWCLMLFCTCHELLSCLGHTSDWPSNNLHKRMEQIFFYFCTSRVFPCNVTIEQNPEFITETAPLEQPEVQCLARGHKWLCLMSRFFRRSNLSEPNHNICLSKIEFRKALLIFYALVMFSILSEILRLWVAGGS